MKTHGYLLEVPHQGALNEYPHPMFLWRNKNSIGIARATTYLELCDYLGSGTEESLMDTPTTGSKLEETDERLRRRSKTPSRQNPEEFLVGDEAVDEVVKVKKPGINIFLSCMLHSIASDLRKPKSINPCPFEHGYTLSLQIV